MSGMRLWGHTPYRPSHSNKTAPFSEPALSIGLPAGKASGHRLAHRHVTDRPAEAIVGGAAEVVLVVVRGHRTHRNDQRRVRREGNAEKDHEGQERVRTGFHGVGRGARLSESGRLPFPSLKLAF